MKRADFYCPGSLLAVLVDTGHPLSYGMPSLAAVMFYDGPRVRHSERQGCGEVPAS